MILKGLRELFDREFSNTRAQQEQLPLPVPSSPTQLHHMTQSAPEKEEKMVLPHDSQSSGTDTA